MTKIALKTAKRNTSVTRLAVKEAVEGVLIKRSVSSGELKEVPKHMAKKSRKH